MQPAPSPALRSLLELATALVSDSINLATVQWDRELAQRTQQAFERLADHAANLDLESIRMAALDLYVYLAAFDGLMPPEAAELVEINRLSLHLESKVAPHRNSAAQAVERSTDPDTPPATSGSVALLGNMPAPAHLVHAFALHGVTILPIASLDLLLDSIGANLPLAIIAYGAEVAGLCATLDGLAKRQPAAANIVVVGVGGNRDDDRLTALLGGCELYLERLDEPTLVPRLMELAQPPDPPFRVLLIDDDESTRLFVRELLQQAGIVVSDIGDPGRAEAEIAEFKPDLVLLDLYMPKTDGMTLTMRLRERADLVVNPIVFLSAEQGEQARLNSIRAGADDFLTKPVQPRDLITSFRSRIHRARSVSRQLAEPARSATARSGRMRRGELLNAIAQAMTELAGNQFLRVLMAVRIDQSERLATQLGQAGAYELEQSIDLRLVEQLQAEDAIALWQEFGFGILVERDSVAELQTLAQRLCQAVAERSFKVSGEDVALSISIGLALPPSDQPQSNPDRWIAAAFAAQAIAHRHGGNRFDGVLEGNDGMPAERVLMIREAVKQVPDKLSLLVEYQPMLQLHGEHQDQYLLSAKLRDFRSPLTGVRRDEYLLAARSAGTLGAIDRLVLERAIAAIEEQRSRGQLTRICVPVDLASFGSAQLQWLSRELTQNRALAARLDLEFDAQLVLDRPPLKGILRGMRALQVGVLLHDDSGDLSRIAAYVELPASTLRIPKSAITSGSAESVSAALKPWRDLGRSVVADGVEDLPSVKQLWPLRVDYVMGEGLAAASPRMERPKLPWRR